MEKIFQNKYFQDFTFVKFTSQMFNSGDESLKAETHLLL